MRCRQVRHGSEARVRCCWRSSAPDLAPGGRKPTDRAAPPPAGAASTFVTSPMRLTARSDPTGAGRGRDPGPWPTSGARACGAGGLTRCSVGRSRTRSAQSAVPRLHDPSLRLARQFGHGLEVPVVVEHDQLAGSGDRGDQSVDQGQLAVLALFGHQGLDFERSAVVGIGGRDVVVGAEAVHDGLVIGGAAGGHTQLEDDGGGESDLSGDGQAGEGGGDAGFAEAGHDAGVDEVARPDADSGHVAGLAVRLHPQARLGGSVDKVEGPTPVGVGEQGDDRSSRAPGRERSRAGRR